MKINSSALVFVTLFGSSVDAFLVPHGPSCRDLKLSVSSTDYLSALSRQAQPPANVHASPSTGGYLGTLSSGVGTPPPQASSSPGYATTPKATVIQGGQVVATVTTSFKFSENPNVKAGPFDSMTPKYPVLQGGQIAEFVNPAEEAIYGIRGYKNPQPKAGPFDSMTPKYPVLQGGQIAEFEDPSNQLAPEMGGYMNSMSKAGPFDSMTPKAPVLQGGQVAEFIDPSEELVYGVRGYKNPRPKAGPFDSMTPKAAVLQGGQVTEFIDPAEEAIYGIRGYRNPNPKAGPFDSMTPKAPVLQGGQIAEFQAPSASFTFPHAASVVPLSSALGSSLLLRGSYAVNKHSRTESFHVLEGLFLLTNADGSAQRCSFGTTIIIPEGWTGRLDVLEPTRLKIVAV
jgi:hypothetical protein